MIHVDMSDEAILREIGSRISRYRLNKNMTQEELAKASGVSLPTIQRAEKGASIQVLSLLGILRALHLIEHVDALVPDMSASPLQQAAMKGKIRKRASHAGKHPEGEHWTWGDEQ